MRETEREQEERRLEQRREHEEQDRQLKAAQEQEMMERVRLVPHEGKRVETGAVQFGDDWPGLFVRGDDCIQLALTLSAALDIIAEMVPDFATKILVQDPLEHIKDTIERSVLVTPLQREVLAQEANPDD